MLGTLSFSQHYLCMQPTMQSRPEIRSPTSPIFTSLFCPYLSIKTSLQSPLTLPSSIPLQFFTSLFLCAAIPKIYLKNISLSQQFSQFRLRQGANEKGSRVRTDAVLVSLSLLPQSIDRDNRAHNHSFRIAQDQKRGALQAIVSDKHACKQNGQPSNLPSSITSNYCHYFHTY